MLLMMKQFALGAYFICFYVFLSYERFVLKSLNCMILWQKGQEFPVSISERHLWQIVWLEGQIFIGFWKS